MCGEDFQCTKFSIWVHLYNLPFEFRNQKCAAALAGLAGAVKDKKFQESESANGYSEYMNVRIEVEFCLVSSSVETEGSRFGSN